eukprot:5432599-Ditylum_brightwellii.AAC.1
MNLQPSKDAGIIMIRFGDVVVAANSVSENEVTCLSPRHSLEVESNTVKVEISTNGGFDFSQSGLIFSYENLPHLVSLHPAVGIELGGNKVEVRGSGFTPNQNARCRFGNNTSPATVLSSEHVQCTVPPSTSIEPVSVDLSMNGFDWTEQALAYTYLPMTTVSAISPSIIPIG